MSRQIIEAMFSIIEWKNENVVFIECPGKGLHTGKNGKKDCRVNLDNAPTIFCLHSSCSSVVEDANYKMRRAIWDNNPLPKREFSPEEKDKIRKDLQEKRKEQDLRDWAQKNKTKLIEKYQWPISDVFHESPFMNEDSKHDANVFVSKMFKPEDVIWNGDVTDTGSEFHRKNFQAVKDFLITENFTCASTFKVGSYSRKNENVLSRPYLVVESDTLTQDETCSFYKWMTGFMTLKAIVYTGGKSMHGWFGFPEDELFKKLKIVLPELGFDEALFKPSQPVRMPGIMRGNKMQSLYYFKP